MISCLRSAGVRVVERHEPVWDKTEHKFSVRAGPALRLAAAELRLLRRPREDFDVVIVGYPGHFDLLAARRAARGRPVVFNPLVSLSDTFVGDRGLVRPGSLSARALTEIDRRAFSASDLVVADTEANAEFLARLADLPLQRVAVCLVGAEERFFRPPWDPSGPVLFVGKLIPLHGLETILAAAELAPEVALRIVGSGQLERLLGDRPANVEWVPWIPYERLAVELRSAAAALGIFGSSPKAARVIPNKVFQALACGTPVITADTPASRELLVDGRDALLVPPGNPEALADALRRLTADTALARRIGAAGLATYHERSSEEVLGQRWRALIEALL